MRRSCAIDGVNLYEDKTSFGLKIDRPAYRLTQQLHIQIPLQKGPIEALLHYCSCQLF